MEGIQYVTSESGQKVAVQINLQKLGEVWDDFYDNVVFQQRKTESRESLDSVRKRLREQGKLHA